MKFLIDLSPRRMEQKIKSNLVMGQLLTPLTRYADWGGIYAIDNGAFSGFREVAFHRLLVRQSNRIKDCLFVVAPDVVGEGQQTLELFHKRAQWIPDEWPIAFVIQDGVEDLEIPWGEMDAVFVGGRDPWKDSQCVADIVTAAKALGIWVHVGRVNTTRRFRHFDNLGADSCDGSGVSRYDHMLTKIETDMESPPEATSV